MPGRVPLARRNLLAEPRRLAASAAGVGMAIMLILLLDGLWAGIEANITTYEADSGDGLLRRAGPAANHRCGAERARVCTVAERVASGLEGEVLEVGFGSGRNVPYYPATVRRVRAVDPSLPGRKLAAKRVAASQVPVEFVGLDGESLLVEDASVDHVLTTWTLCTIPDVERALGEMCRVLRPGGALHFVEHGRAPDPKVARWQDRLTPMQRRVAGGCHLNRPIDELIAGAGLHVARIENYYLRGPKVLGYMFEGVATKQ